MNGIDNAGEANDQYELGVMYCSGKGKPQDYAKAAELFSLAAEKGHLAAKRELGILYLLGEGVKADADKAYPLLTEAAQVMDPNAMYHLAFMYERGVGVEKDLKEALRLFAFAAEMEYAGAEEDADRVEALINEERKQKLRTRRILHLVISDDDVEEACCKKMYDAVLDGTIVVADTYKGPQLIGEDDNGNEIILNACPFCGHEVRRVKSK